MNIILFSHSDYSFLWPIIEEYFLKITGIESIFVSNKTSLKKPNGFIQYIEYDDSLCYAQRWIRSIIPKINTDYIVIIHDVNILLNCDTEIIKSIINIMRDYHIDRCSLNVFEGIEIINNENIKLCNLKNANSITFIPYDVCPAIWNKNSFNTLFNNFPNETYRGSELNKELQQYCTINFKIFGIQKDNEKIYYCLGRPYTNHFKILHITTQNELTFPNEVYMDTKEDFEYIFSKYKLEKNVKINNSYSWILSNFKPYKN